VWQNHQDCPRSFSNNSSKPSRSAACLSRLTFIFGNRRAKRGLHVNDKAAAEAVGRCSEQR